MTDLIEALLNPLLVTDERFDLTRKAAAEIKRLEAALEASESLKRGYFDEIERLRAERDEWKANYEAAFDALTATIKEFNP